jgi:hypothetical protein
VIIAHSQKKKLWLSPPFPWPRKERGERSTCRLLTSQVIFADGPNHCSWAQMIYKFNCPQWVLRKKERKKENVCDIFPQIFTQSLVESDVHLHSEDHLLSSSVRSLSAVLPTQREIAVCKHVCQPQPWTLSYVTGYKVNSSLGRHSAGLLAKSTCSLLQSCRFATFNGCFELYFW